MGLLEMNVTYEPDLMASHEELGLGICGNGRKAYFGRLRPKKLASMEQ